MKGIVSESNAMRHPTYGRVQLSDAVVELPSSHAMYQAFVVRRCRKWTKDFHSSSDAG